MPALKSIPITHPDTGAVLGQRFESSDSFLRSLGSNYVPMTRPDGKAVRANKKLAARGHYDDKGFTEGKPQKEGKGNA